MPMVEIDGYRVAYERVGAGPPLLLLHGYVGDGASTWGRSSTRSPMTSPSSHGMRRGRADRRILLNASGWRDTPIAWPGSSIAWRWTSRMWSVCPSAVHWRSNSVTSSRGPFHADARRRLRRMGAARFRPRRRNSVSARRSSCPSCRPTSSSTRCCRPCSPTSCRRMPSMRSRGDAHVSPRRLPGYGACGGRGLAGGAAVHRSSDAPDLWRRRHPGAERPLPIICTKPFGARPWSGCPALVTSATSKPPTRQRDHPRIPPSTGVTTNYSSSRMYRGPGPRSAAWSSGLRSRQNFKREAAAADAAVEAVAEPFEHGDLRRGEDATTSTVVASPWRSGCGSRGATRARRGSRRGSSPTCWATRMNETRRKASRA